MSKAGALLWRTIFETNDARRLAKQAQDTSDLSIERDIAYIDDGDRGHLFDVYRLPDAPADAPVVVNIHGGGLFASYKDLNANFNYEWARRGYAVVSISYRRIPDVTLWHQVDDVMAALRYVAEHAGELGLDLGRCFITGDSAGALLAYFALALEGSAALRDAFGIAPCGIEFRAAGFISIMLDTQRTDLMRTISDVVTGDEDLGRPYERYLLDPGAMVGRTQLPPIYLVTSEEDLIRNDTMKLQGLLASSRVANELLDFPRGGERKLVHVFSVAFPHYPESRIAIDAMSGFFKKQVGQRECPDGLGANRDGGERQPAAAPAKSGELLDYERDHLARIRAGLAECMVLLRKDGSFPLGSPCRLAAFGNGVRHGVKGGTGSGDVNAHVVVGIERGLLDAGFELTSGAWLDAYDERRLAAKAAFRKQLKREAKAAGDFVISYAMGAVMPEPEYDIPLDYSADAAIYVLSRISGEGSDRKPVAGDVLLTATEVRDILALNGRYERFMLVLNTGGPVDLSPVKDVGNILVLSQLGSEMGNALADVLLGAAVPSGKLATTWSAWDDYCPDIEMGGLDDTPYREGVYVGYRYFDTVGKRALFPFGFGLSYTEFELSKASVELAGPRATVSVEVRNAGDFPGKEVVQVYVTAPERELRKPWQELAGFAKTGLLQPGATERVEVAFDFADLASYSEEACAYVLEAGEYVVRAGTCSADARAVAVVGLGRGVVLRTVRSIVAPAGIDEVAYDRVARDEQLGGLPRLMLDPGCFQVVDVAYDADPEVDPVVASLTDRELAYAGVGRFSGIGGLFAVIGNASTLVAGAAGETASQLRNVGFEPVVMADGPAGLRLAREFYRDDKGAHALGAGSIPEGILDVLSAPVRAVALKLLSGKKPPRGAEALAQYCTALPIGTAIAQSWNLEFARTCGDVVGAEMERFGVDLWLAPALNIHRSVLCGRNFEYFSEDPLVSGKMAAALVNGVQAHPGRGATIKHFAANNQETNRYFNNSQVGERALREVYLRGFGTCLRESRPAAVMTSYNLLNGTHTSESRGLIEGYLRAECGFDGVVMTDWVLPLKNRGERWPIARASRVAAAGGDLFMPGSKDDFKDILAALSSGELGRHQLEANATRVLRLATRGGLPDGRGRLPSS